ncbi:linker histone H1 and H5 family protein [Necator americanus]|uniref:Linker histone H1 and H5 family protein n=1 Tax=Necator americanus TaxID=51031 RepID=W2TEX0_NECAM|nr:linker histone H1 and H5 family protein [Necator americanus]ETN80144.1 linker histone H1 and H5 family protein [Necator americanus]
MMSVAAVSSSKRPPKATALRVPKSMPEHPTYAVMVKDAITQLKERSGSSKSAILKYITQHYKLGDNVTMINVHLKRALARGVAKGELKQVSGIGATGSFKVDADYKKLKKTAAPTVKKPVAKKATSEPIAPKKAPAPKPKIEKKLKTPKKEVVKKKVVKKEVVRKEVVRKEVVRKEAAQKAKPTRNTTGSSSRKTVKSVKKSTASRV